MNRIFGGVRKSFLYILLSIYSLTIFFPIILMLLTSFKENREIFTNAFGLPKSYSFATFIELFTKMHYVAYFRNSLIVTLTSIILILIVSSLASYVLAKYSFFGRKFIYLYFIIGIMIPIRLGTISMLKMMLKLNLYDNLGSLIIIYIAMGIPFGIFVLTDFIKLIPEELSNSARLDGCSEPQIFFRIIIPLLRPALVTVAIINFVPIWNDFWFPLIFINSDNMKTIPLATAIFFGNYETNFKLVFTALSVATIPVVAIYFILFRQFGKGVLSGAIKG